METTKRVPVIDPRFIYMVKRKNKETRGYDRVPALNADGHIDCAHQMDLGNLKTEVIESIFTSDNDGGTTHWVTVMATVDVGGRTVTGISCTNSRNVQEPGFETSVAETRAIKRAIAVACNITEKLINPGGAIPTRDMVDLPIDDPQHDESDIPEEMKKPASEIIDASEQFKV